MSRGKSDSNRRKNTADLSSFFPPGNENKKSSHLQQIAKALISWTPTLDFFVLYISRITSDDSDVPVMNGKQTLESTGL